MCSRSKSTTKLKQGKAIGIIQEPLYKTYPAIATERKKNTRLGFGDSSHYSCYVFKALILYVARCLNNGSGFSKGTLSGCS
uniref:Uncharacterized protein n=1 Tax=Helianthus annuus TaxID=4232 RepID=A0A251S8R3_HELAN